MGKAQHVLVAGGAGFLGSHLCERLLAEGHRVFCLDDFSSASPQNVAHLVSRPEFTLIEQDVAAPLELAVEAIFDLACPASPIHYQRTPVATARAILLGAANLLELAAARGARILLASTSEVYGDPEVHPQPESYRGHVSPVGPRSCYNESKRAAEALFFAYRREHDLDIKVARIFNTYGPRMGRRDGRVISSFILSALSGEPLTVHGDGSQTRSFCYVDDLVDGLMRLMGAPPSLTGPVNLGTPEETTVRELAERILDLTGSRSALAFEPRPEDDPRRRCPDISLARETLGWTPRTSLEEGLRRTIAYYAGDEATLRGPDSAGPTSLPGRG